MVEVMWQSAIHAPLGWMFARFTGQFIVCNVQHCTVFVFISILWLSTYGDGVVFFGSISSQMFTLDPEQKM